ncbi:hypothetical protein KUCAC02_037875 [Chaenocephalus aceratus]|nr:hypothetical protein KUCAC02_037875 [Chaenocephalus aceratus]
MTGRKSGLVARAKERNPTMIATHCMLHRQALASTSVSPELPSVLSTVVSVVNHIKCKPQSRLFGQLCRETGAGQDTLLFHSEWRSSNGTLDDGYGRNTVIRPRHPHRSDKQHDSPSDTQLCLKVDEQSKVKSIRGLACEECCCPGKDVMCKDHGALCVHVERQIRGVEER